MKKKQYILWWGFTFILVALFVVFGLDHIGQFMTVDEPKWLYKRIPFYIKGWQSGNWIITMINDKPGVLPAMLAGLSTLSMDLKAFAEADALPEYLFWWRMPIVVFNGVMLLCIFHFSKQLFSKHIALLLTGLLALNPVLVGMSQIVNPDSTLWTMTFLTFLTYLLYLKKEQRRYMILSGLFFGFGLLAKYNTSLFYLVFFIILYLEYLFGKIDQADVLRKSKGLFTIYLISIAIYLIAIPACWERLDLLINGTINPKVIRGVNKPFLVLMCLLYAELWFFKGRLSDYLRQQLPIRKGITFIMGIAVLSFGGFVLLNHLLNYAIFDFHYVRFAISTRWDAAFFPALLASINTTMLVLPISVLLGSLVYFLVVLSAEKHWHEKIAPYQDIMLYGLLIVVLFIFGTSISGHVAQTRYQIMLYPLFTLIAAVIWIQFVSRKWLITGLLLSISLLELLQVQPFYYCYSNILNYNNQVVTDSWGMGYYEVAKAAETIPDAENIAIWSDQGFTDFFTTEAYGKTMVNPLMTDVDYVAISHGGYHAMMRVLNEGEFMFQDKKIVDEELLRNFLERYNEKEGVFQVNVGNNPNNYVKLVKVDDMADLKRNAADRIYTNTKVDLSAAYSIAFWMKMNVEKAGAPIFLEDTIASVKFEPVQNEASTAYLFQYEDVGDCAYITTDSLELNKEHHIILYQTGGEVGDEYGIYVDGVLQSKCDIRKAKTGQARFAISNGFKGNLQDMRIYEKVLSEAEVEAIYNKGQIRLSRSLFSGLNQKFEPKHHWVLKAETK